MRLISLTIVMLILSCHYGYCAQKNKKPQNKVKKQVSKEQDNKKDEFTFSTIPISFDTNKLPPKYIGHSLSSITSQLKERVYPKKDEYETSEQFNTRIADLWKAPLIGSMTIENDFMLVLTPKSRLIEHGVDGWFSVYLTEIRHNYDADKKQLNIEVNPDFCVKDNKPIFNATCINAHKLYFEYREYVAENAMGASVKVKKTSSSINSLYFDLNTRAEINLILENVDPQNAKRLKTDIAVGIVYKLKDPYYRNAYRNNDPTFTDPNDNSTSYSYAVGKVSSYWIFDFNTGEILKKFSAQDFLAISQ